MPTYWGKPQIQLLLDLFRREPPVIDPHNLPRGEKLSRYIDDYSDFAKFEGHNKTFYTGVKRYDTQFRDDQDANDKGDKRKGMFFKLFYLIFVKE